jgi:polyphosphate kinase
LVVGGADVDFSERLDRRAGPVVGRGGAAVAEPPEADEPDYTFDPDDPSLLANRELSWLDFNARVLAEAFDAHNPLLERVKFLAITASNLDEFYAKRVGWLMYGLRSRAGDRRTPDGLTLQEQLDLVVERCLAMRRHIERCWGELRLLLEAAGVTVTSHAALEPAARERLAAYFEAAIFPVLTPLIVDAAHPFPFISGGSLSVVAMLDGDTSGRRIARVKVPANRPRFVDVGDGRFVPLEEVIVAHLDLLFPGVHVEHWETIRVLRSAEIGTPGEAAEDLLELIEQAIAQRRLAFVCSLEVGGKAPESDVSVLLEELELGPEHVVRLDGLLGLDDLFELAALPRPDLAVKPVTPAVPPAFAAVPDGELLDRIELGDLLVHHPYESFDATVVRFIEEAARDPQVLAIKQTLYRTSPDSPILAALIGAASRGKQVAVVVELTARFDEANNIDWARRLERAGVHVAYGSPTRKIHSKISLVVREHGAGVSVLGHIGTGNYNSNTARIYEDIGLFTADPVITSDLVRVFNHLTGAAELTATAALLVAPMTLRPRMETRILREIEHARAGRPARIAMKMNALEDPEVTRLLYRASMAGVQVDLAIRGICRLRPGLPGVSEHVRVVSVIGRFLEHSRIFYFANGGAPEWFVGSADLMKRNLDDRVEVVTPVRDPGHQRRLGELLELLLGDRRQGWTLEDLEWHRDQVPEAGTHETLLRRVGALPVA